MQRNAFRVWLLLVTCVLLLAGCGAARRPEFSMEREAPAPLGMAAGEEAPGEGDGGLAGAPPAPGLQRKVIARASVALVVADTTATVTEINRLVAEAGGYVSDSNLYKSSYGSSEVLRGSLTLRVPADQLDQVLAQLETLAVDVDSRNVNREDVTDQYTDIEAQLINLEATEKELRALLAEVRAKPNATAEDILAVHRRMTEVRGEIEQLQGRKNMLDNLIGLATIEVTLIPDIVNRPVVEAGWRPAVVMRDALRALVKTLQFLGDAAIWIVIFVLPLLLLVLIPAFVLFWLLRLWSRRQRMKKRAVQAGGGS